MASIHATYHTHQIIDILWDFGILSRSSFKASHLEMCENAHAKHRKPQSIQGSCNYCEGAAIKDKYHLTAVWIALNQITFQLTLWKVAGATVTSEDYRQAESTDVPVRDWQQAAARREREGCFCRGCYTATQMSEGS